MKYFIWYIIFMIFISFLLYISLTTEIKVFEFLFQLPLFLVSNETSYVYAIIKMILYTLIFYTSIYWSIIFLIGISNKVFHSDNKEG